MNKFLELFGGPIAVLSSIITCMIIARRWRSGRHQHTRKHLIPVLYWGPVFLMACMALHLFRNGYNTIVSVFAGQATFSFYHYSLQLFGMVVAYQAWLLLQQCRRHVNSTVRFNRKLYRAQTLILISTLPTFAFTPIGIVPSVVLVITFLVSLLVHRPASVENNLQQQYTDDALLQATEIVTI